jgi:hypothetical protein
MYLITVTFCTTCKGRLKHLKTTLPLNLQIIDEWKSQKLGHDLLYQFVILNYNSKDGLDEWIQSKYAEDGRVTHFHETSVEGFHMSKAKNLAHRGAEKCDVLVNLDADNILTEEYLAELGTFAAVEGPDVIYCNQPGMKGLCGRVAYRQDVFYQLGGYDESFEPYGYEDFDFLERAKRAGLKLAESKNGLCLAHVDAERVVNIKCETPEHIYVMINRNKLQSEKNIQCKRWIANPTGWGEATLIKNFKEKLEWEAIIP